MGTPLGKLVGVGGANITGGAESIGNPMYHWCNLEPRQFFGYDKHLTLEDARECWNFRL